MALGFRKEIDGKVSDLGEKVTEVNKKIDDMADNVGRMMTAFQDMLTGRAPVTIRRTSEPMEMDQGPDHVARFSEDVNPTNPPELVMPKTSNIDDPIFRQKLELEKFLAEKIRIFIHEDNAENPMETFEIRVNGKPWLFERNKEYEVPRYVVEGLMRARPVHYRNEEYIDIDGVKKTRWPSRRGLRFPFSPISPTQKDNEWLRKLAREP